jgi:septal ring factor EnvC (AmiA/AmiB activator)
MLAYYNFFSNAQAEQIQELRTALQTLDHIQADIDTQLLALNTLEAEAKKGLTTLQEQRSERAGVLSGIESQISTEQGRLQELSRDQKDLEALLARLTSALADIPANIPSDMGEYLSPAQQRGQLPRPVAGKIRHAFGQTRAGGMNWTGWLIEAEAGSEIRAIAYGRVAYADWLRGYGLLIIIDHGDGFMSLYGNNESLLFEVGDWVQPGAVISTAGETPGLEQGLYFELRRQGKAVDPAAWLASK